MREMFAATTLLLASTLACAAPFSADVTDLWRNPSESGWGVNLVQQSNKVFATFSLYGHGSGL